VSLAPALAELLALRLGAKPQTPAAHSALCSWLQKEIDRDPGAVRYGRASQRLAHQAIQKVAAPALISELENWLEQRFG
jgi:hypothetical protein